MKHLIACFAMNILLQKCNEFGNLDSASGKEILELLKKVNQEYGITILMVTHSPESTEYGNRVIHLSDGQINKCLD